VDIPFYVEHAKAARGPVLEVACGTGRVMIPSLQAGADIEGIDLHPGMLAVLRKRAGALGLTPRAELADMRDFTMPRRYKLITIPFRAFQHLTNTEDQLRTLRCLREHLEPGGSLIFNLFHPSFDALCSNPSITFPDREVVHPETGLPVVMHDASRELDRVQQLMNIEREIIESDARGYAHVIDRHAFTLRWTYKAEMELLLRLSGFTRWDVRGGFDGQPLEKDTDEMVWTAWKD
jgi:SAM-dependent methyltransferase